jgi:hypothetical protein
MTELEIELRSWAPRPPSAALKQRIFAPLRPPAWAPPRFTFHVSRFTLNWLAPSAAALGLLVLLATHYHHPALSPATAPRPMIALAWSNQLYAASSNEQFAAPAASLASTNLRPFSSSSRGSD